jgi:hypothetical protein
MAEEIFIPWTGGGELNMGCVKNHKLTVVVTKTLLTLYIWHVVIFFFNSIYIYIFVLFSMDMKT